MAGKNVFADGSNVYTKSGSTEFQVMSSTGGLYHQGVVLPDSTLLSVLKTVTWPSTVAQTLVNTTSVQTLTNKTLNGGSSPSTTVHTLVSTTDVQTLSGKTIVNTVEILTASSGGLTPSSMIPYGVSWIQVSAGDLSTSPRLATLGAPITGVEKTIIFATTAAYINTLDVDLGIGVGVGHITGTSDARYIGFSTLATEYQTVNLIGLTTALWGVKSVDSTVGGFGTAAGIRSLTAARTS